MSYLRELVGLPTGRCDPLPLGATSYCVLWAKGAQQGCPGSWVSPVHCLPSTE